MGGKEGETREQLEEGMKSRKEDCISYLCHFHHTLFPYLLLPNIVLFPSVATGKQDNDEERKNIFKK